MLLEDEEAAKDLLQFKLEFKETADVIETTAKKKLNIFKHLNLRGASAVFRRFGASVTASMTSAIQGVSRFGRGLQSVGAQIFNFRNFAVGGIGFAAVVNEATKMESLEGRFKQVFQGLTDEARGFSETLSSSIRQSPRLIRTQLVEFQAFLQGIGLGADRALQFSKSLSQVAQDVVAFKDDMTDADEVLRVLIGALSGSNTEGALKLFAAPLRQADLKRRFGAVGKDLDIGTQALLRFQIITEALRDQGALGQAAREVDQLGSIFRFLAASAKDLAGVIGLALSPAIKKIAIDLTDFIVGLQHWVEENPKVVQAVALMGVQALAAGAGIAALGTALVGVSAVVAAFGAAVTFLVSPLGALTTGLAIAAISMTDFKGAAKGFGEAFSGGVQTAIEKLNVLQQGIRAALDKGDFELAGKIAITALEVGIIKGLQKIHAAFMTWKAAIQNVFTSMAAQIKKTMTQIVVAAEVRVLQSAKAWTDILNYIPGGSTLRKTLRPIIGEVNTPTRNAIQDRIDAAKAQGEGIVNEIDSEAFTIMDDRARAAADAVLKWGEKLKESEGKLENFLDEANLKSTEIEKPKEEGIARFDFEKPKPEPPTVPAIPDQGTALAGIASKVFTGSESKRDKDWKQLLLQQLESLKKQDQGLKKQDETNQQLKRFKELRFTA